MNKKNVALLSLLICVCGFIPLSTNKIYEVFVAFFNIRRGIADSYVFESMMRFLFPQIIFFACFGDYFYVNIINNASMLFIRSKNQNYVVKRYTKSLVINTGASVLIVWGMIVLLRIMQGEKINADKSIVLLLWAIEYGIYLLFSILVSNILSIIIGAAEATATIFFIKIIEIILVAKASNNNVYNIIARVMPISIIADRWNCVKKITNKTVTKTLIVQNFFIPIVLGIILCIVAIKVCSYILKRKEWV